MDASQTFSKIRATSLYPHVFGQFSSNSITQTTFREIVFGKISDLMNYFNRTIESSYAINHLTHEMIILYDLKLYHDTVSNILNIVLFLQ